MSSSPSPKIDWSELRNRPLALEEKQLVREFYDGSYPERSNYLARHPLHLTISYFRARLLQAIFPMHGKVLDMGCAGGGDVLAFRQLGIDAWGFDLCPDLPDIAYPEVRTYVRIGRPDHMPFAATDGFRTLVSYDVLEHVPVDVLEGIPAELDRLGIEFIDCVIAKDTISAGHITIQDTAWWVALFARAGFRLCDELTEALAEVIWPLGWDPGNEQVIFGRYPGTGSPPNAWNAVPGHLFFRRS